MICFQMNTGILYLSLHNLLRKKCNPTKVLRRKEIFTILGRHFLVPKNIRVAVIKEMQLMKLLKPENGNCFKILEYHLNVEKDAHKFYRTLKLFEKSPLKNKTKSI